MSTACNTLARWRGPLGSGQLDHCQRAVHCGRTRLSPLERTSGSGVVPNCMFRDWPTLQTSGRGCSACLQYVNMPALHCILSRLKTTTYFQTAKQHRSPTKFSLSHHTRIPSPYSGLNISHGRRHITRLRHRRRPCHCWRFFFSSSFSSCASGRKPPAAIGNIHPPDFTIRTNCLSFHDLVVTNGKSTILLPSSVPFFSVLHPALHHNPAWPLRRSAYHPIATTPRPLEGPIVPLTNDKGQGVLSSTSQKPQ